ncbi:MAG TPA: radical SAM protein [Terriglobia bacterium]|nr:radical SAM protein [Terriglobia bacterium]
MVDVLLTHSYHLYYDRKQARKMQPYPPLGTLYAAALLRQRGYSVALFDPMLEDPVSGFPQALRRARPRVVALCEDNFNFLSKMCLSRMREVAMQMIGLSRASGAQVVVNGSDSTDHLVQYLQGGANFILVGEVERTLLELVDSLVGRSGQLPIEIPGLAFIKQQSGRLYKTPPRPLIQDLDELPFPARDLVDLERYRDEWKSAHHTFSLNLVASRGCPYRCNWCAKPIYGDRFHSRSAANVAREMALLKTEYGAEHLWFADDIFGIKNSWVLEFAEQVERLGAAVPFKMQTRADLMKEDVALAFRRAGCNEAWLGVESGSQKILDAMDKGLRVDQVVKARGHLRHAGIRTCFFLQFGYSGETWPDIQKTIELVRHTRPEDIGVSVSYPLPGTAFHARVREQLGSKTNWIDSEDLAMMFKGAYTTEFYRALRNAIHAEVETWSPPSAGSVNFSEVRGHEPGDGKAQTLAQLWAKVEAMEKTSRNEAPTLLPVLTCAPEAATC